MTGVKCPKPANCNTFPLMNPANPGSFSMDVATLSASKPSQLTLLSN